MRRLITLVLFVLVAAGFGCKAKEMTLEDFARIDIEITSTDMKPESVAKVAEKYGYTLEQYRAFEEKIRNDQALQEKLGEIRLKNMKPETGQ